MTITTRKPLTTFNAIFPWRSLKTRVTIFTLAIFLVGMWSLAFFASYTLRNDMERALSDQQFSTVSVIAADISTQLEDRIRALEAAAAIITPAMMGKQAVMQAYLEGHPALATLFNSGLWVTNAAGDGIADVPIATGRIGVNYSDREFMIGAFKGKTTIGKPVMGRMLKAPAFAIAAPVRDAKGSVIGTLLGAINLGKPNFLDKIAGSRYGRTGGYILVDTRHQLFITATDKSYIMQPFPKPGINQLFERYVQGFEGSGVVVDSRGHEVLSSAKQIPLAGWFAVARMPTDEAFAPIRTLQKRVLLATIFLTLLAGGLTWWMLKRQLAPVFATIKTLATLSDTGQPPQPLAITRQDEIGALIGGFNHLLEALGQREEIWGHFPYLCLRIWDAT